MSLCRAAPGVSGLPSAARRNGYDSDILLHFAAANGMMYSMTLNAKENMPITPSIIHAISKTRVAGAIALILRRPTMSSKVSSAPLGTL